MKCALHEQVPRFLPVAEYAWYLTITNTAYSCPICYQVLVLLPGGHSAEENFSSTVQCFPATHVYYTRNGLTLFS